MNNRNYCVASLLLALAGGISCTGGPVAPVASVAPAAAAPAPVKDAPRPNILWIIVEDMSAHFSCYGETTIKTPSVDALAREGVRFTNAVITCPVCSPSRSAMITGMYQTTIGAHQHRSGRGTLKIHLPEKIQLVPKLFQDAGYLTLNLRFEEFMRSDTAVEKNPRVNIAKTDYNFQWDKGVYDRVHWTQREQGQPFFVQVQLHGGKYRGNGHNPKWSARVKKTLGSNTSPEQVTLPPYYPRDPVILQDWADYLDTVRYTDWEVGRIVTRLADAGDLEQTVLIFITDHGISHARGKQFLYDEGMRIPFIVRGPGIPRGEVRGDPIEHIDMAALSLGLARIKVPDWMQARDVFAHDYQPRGAVFSARDRCDETVERMRAVRTPLFKYIRNFYPRRPHLQPNRYKDGKAVLRRLREMHQAGQLDPIQELLFAPTRPAEELYDLRADPFEIKNLADDPAHRATLKTLRARLDRWIKETKDQGPESEAMYDSDMAVYQRGKGKKRGKKGDVLANNIRLMKKWAREGK